MSRPSKNNFDPGYSFPPGETLAEIIAEKGMKQAELARRAGLSVKLINQIVQGIAPVSADTALRLERVTGLTALFWSKLEAAYQVTRVEENESARLAAESDWFKALPLKELQRRGWLTSKIDPIALAREALDFFRVATPEAWSEVWALPTAYRKSQAYEPDYGALAAWIRIGERRAENELSLPTYDRAGFRASLLHIRALTNEQDPNLMVARLTDLCRASGVALIVEKEIKGARINGLVRWLPSGNPLIMLSMRYNWADIFWFTFFHEAGHLLVHERRATFIDIPGQRNADPDVMDRSSENRLLEEEADDFSGRTLLPKAFDARLRHATDAASVRRIASEAGVHTGVVVGRLQHDQVIHFSQLNHLRIRFKFAD